MKKIFYTTHSLQTVFLTISLFLLAGIQRLTALPGITPLIADTSGEYVYYKDSSFARESYIGFLYYNDSTYAVRYYAPAALKEKILLPEKNIEILFTMNAQKQYVELTGEKIISPVTAEDTDIVNYIHDLLYELTARRQKAGNFTDQVTLPQNYPQFGGLVSITFESSIPLFNIKSIKKSDGTDVFSSITAGQLVSSADKSFSSFKGLPQTIGSDNTHLFKQNSKSKKITYRYNAEASHTQSVQLDSQWLQSMDNLWLLGDSAILTMNSIKPPSGDYVHKITRKMILGTENTYPDWTKLVITKKGNSISIENTFYQPLSGSITKDFKIITPLPDGSFAFFTLTVFANVYALNKDYFSKIIQSYTPGA